MRKAKFLPKYLVFISTNCCAESGDDYVAGGVGSVGNASGYGGGNGAEGGGSTCNDGGWDNN